MLETIVEEWKAIKGFEGCYEVSSLGRIRSCPRRYHKGFRIMTLQQHNGYCVIKLHHCSDRKQYKKFRVHQLVASAFLDNPEDKDYVNHKNKDRKNNSIANLEWCTHAENMYHRDNYTPADEPF